MSLALVMSLMLVTASQAYSGAREGGRIHVVRPGETLWEVAREVDPEADTRVIVRELMVRNGLRTVSLVPGQGLVLP